jgi:EAL domain-containing protein (putative c-di-GMP-specific phosphodiesterase class I)
VSLQDRKVVAAEVLLRWEHPQHGLIPPGEFIPLAEETGAILPLGAWVFGEACNCLERFPALNYLSVNVSRRQLLDPAFLPAVDAVLSKTRIERRRGAHADSVAGHGGLPR